MGAQAAEGLAYAHGRGFVHRDIKPANLALRRGGPPAHRRLRPGPGPGRGGHDRAGRHDGGHRPLRRPRAGPRASTSTAAPTSTPRRSSSTRRSPVSSPSPPTPPSPRSWPASAPSSPATTPWARWPRCSREAAAPDADDRLDAAGFAARLRELGDSLPAPRALRLAGAGGRRGAAPHRRRRPPTGTSPSTAWSSPRRQRRGRRARGGEDPDVLAFATAVGVADGGAGAAAVLDTRRRRWPWVVAGRDPGAWPWPAPAPSSPSRRPSHPRRPATSLRVDHRPDAGPGPAELAPRQVPGGRSPGTSTSITAPKGQILTPDAPARGRISKGGATVSVVVSSGLPTVAIPALDGGDRRLPGHRQPCSRRPPADGRAPTPTRPRVPKGTVIAWSPKGSAPYGSTGHRDGLGRTASRDHPLAHRPDLHRRHHHARGRRPGGQLHQRRTAPRSRAARSISWSPTGAALEGHDHQHHHLRGPPTGDDPRQPLRRLTVSRPSPPCRGWA